jgi:acyl carrier protein
MNATQLKSEIKALLVDELNLQGKDPAAIEDDAPLFGDEPKSLGLDSLDALQLAIGIEERFGVRIPEGDEARPIFRSVSAIAEHIAAQKANGHG